MIRSLAADINIAHIREEHQCKYCNLRHIQLSDCKTEEWGLFSASIVTSGLASHQTVRNMNKFIQERNLISASIEISSLDGHYIARDMKKCTQERNLISARIVISSLERRQIIRSKN